MDPYAFAIEKYELSKAWEELAKELVGPNKQQDPLWVAAAMVVASITEPFHKFIDELRAARMVEVMDGDPCTPMGPYICNVLQSTMPSPSGIVANHHLIEIGKGKSTVYLARTDQGKDVAAKVMPSDPQGPEGWPCLYAMTEVLAYYRLQGKVGPKLHGMKVSDTGKITLFMDLVLFRSESLILTEYQDNLPVFFKSALAALAEMHKMGLAHRDIKIPNIRMDHDFKAVLLDFDSCSMSHSDHRTTYPVTTITNRCPSRVFWHNRADYDATKVDIWSLAVVVMMLASKKFRDILQHVKDERSFKAAYSEVFVEDGPKPEMWDDWPRAFNGMKTVLSRMTCFNPVQRPTANEALRILSSPQKYSLFTSTGHSMVKI